MATINLGRIKPVFRGAYSGATAYVVDDIVTSGNETFICILASTGNATSNATYWTKLAAKGVDGTDGTDIGTTITTQGDVLYRDGSGLQRLAAGTSGQFLKTQGSGANPVWATSGLAAQAVHTSATLTAVAGRAYPINTTSNACTITLPAGSVGDSIQFIDYAGTWDTNNITLTANGSEKIKGSTDDKVCNQERQAITINYVDATQGWVVSSTVNQSSTDDAIIPPPTLVDFLVVGGGGGSSDDNSGGGGAGGYRYFTGQEVTASAVYTATVGAGGTSHSNQGTRGGTSSFIGTGISVSATGGGGASADGATISSAGDGGSGAGAGQAAGGSDGGDGNLGGYSPVEGYDGGYGTASVSRGGGGGGSSAVGANGTAANTGGVGGAGTANSITGSSVTYAGGGGGGGAQDNSSGAAGGAGGGGAGSAGGATATDGTNYLGGGAGGGGQAGGGATGGVGIVIMRILTSKYSGTYTNAQTPIVDGDYTVLKWHSTGTYTA